MENTLKIGVIVKPQGIKGEVKVQPLTDDITRFKKLKKVIIPKSTWKMFDCYSYSYLTDSLPVDDNLVYLDKLDSLKATKIISFRKSRGNK